jgi:hypothetical protein
MTPASLAARIASDPAYAARLGNPTPSGQVTNFPFGSLMLGYPPLVDLTVETARLIETGDFAAVNRNGWACFSPPPADVVARVVEFYNARLDHYFYTADAGEIAAIEAGVAGPGWTRTGEGFYADVAPGCKFDPDSPVYRFAGIPGRGPSSHFFTRDRAECDVVNRTGQWSFEGLPFWAGEVHADGTCGDRRDQVALLRAWRPFGDSNHRFTTDPRIVAETVNRGWVAEGPVMCVRLPPPQ